MDKNKTSVIMSGSDNEIFKPPEIKYKSEKTKLVTQLELQKIKDLKRIFGLITYSKMRIGKIK